MVLTNGTHQVWVKNKPKLREPSGRFILGIGKIMTPQNQIFNNHSNRRIWRLFYCLKAESLNPDHSWYNFAHYEIPHLDRRLPNECRRLATRRLFA